MKSGFKPHHMHEKGRGGWQSHLTNGVCCKHKHWGNSMCGLLNEVNMPPPRWIQCNDKHDIIFYRVWMNHACFKSQQNAPAFFKRPNMIQCHETRSCSKTHWGCGMNAQLNPWCKNSWAQSTTTLWCTIAFPQLCSALHFTFQPDLMMDDIEWGHLRIRFPFSRVDTLHTSSEQMSLWICFFSPVTNTNYRSRSDPCEVHSLGPVWMDVFQHVWPRPPPLWEAQMGCTHCVEETPIAT